MESTVLLSNSLYCRLCADENGQASDIFAIEENNQNLCQLINKYLPLKVHDEDQFPRKICPGCRIQLEATKIFLDLVVDGQAKLRELHKIQQDKLNREEKKRLQLQEVLQNVNPNSSVETYTIEADENGEKYVIQIFSEGPLFPPDHELSLKAEGLDKPRRKRGRPPKPPPDPVEENVFIEEVKQVEIREEEEEVGPDGRRKRKIRAPTRYQGVVQGKELDKIFVEEGVLDYEEIESTENADTTLKAIGRIERDDEDQNNEPVLVHKVRTKSRHPSILKRKRKYTCEVCKKDFLHYGRYEHHKKSHNIFFVCQQADCGLESKEKQVIVDHQTESGHTGINPVEKIDTIGRELLPETILQQSDLIVTEENVKNSQYECEECNKAFTCKQNYEVHVRAVHEQEKPFACDKCEMTFSYGHSLKLHQIVHTKEPDSEVNSKHYPCTSCNKVFTHPSSLLYHKNSEHNNGRRFVCNKCNKAFKHRQLLQRHQLVHTDERPFKCSICRAGFKTRANLTNHEAVHTGQKKFCCSQCGQYFAHKTSLTMHLRWHEGHKPYQCDVCHKAFTQKGNLLEHKRIHTGEKPYTCTMCGKSFTTSSQYKLHCKRHTGEKPWKCDHCTKSFLHKDTWKTHTRRHLNDRPFKCKCGRAFSEAWALKKHERLHSGEKPYKCDKCGKCYADSSNMKKHRRTHNTITKHTLIQVEGQPLMLEKPDLNGEAEKPQVEYQVQEVGEQGQIILNNGIEIIIKQEDTPVDSNIKGLLPDGTIVALDWNMQNKDLFQIQGVEVGDPGLLGGEIQYMQASEEDVEKEVQPNNNLRLITEDGQEMCFVTAYAVDENTLNQQILM